MPLVLILIILILLFGGGGFYFGAPYHFYGGGLSHGLGVFTGAIFVRNAAVSSCPL